MKAETIAAIAAVITLAGQAANYVLLLRIRVGLLETRKSIMDEVEQKFVRKDSALLIERPHAAA